MLVQRRYKKADLDCILALHNLASEEIGVPRPDSYFSDLHQIEEAFLNKDGEFVVGECESRIVAMGGFKKTSHERAEITLMRVHPNFQRRGFRSVNLRYLEKRAAELGYQTFHLDTLAVQAKAQALYLRNGYMFVGQGKKDKFDVIFFEKNLEA